MAHIRQELTLARIGFFCLFFCRLKASFHLLQIADIDKTFHQIGFIMELNLFDCLEDGNFLPIAMHQNPHGIV